MVETGGAPRGGGVCEDLWSSRASSELVGLGRCSQLSIWNSAQSRNEAALTTCLANDIQNCTCESPRSLSLGAFDFGRFFRAGRPTEAVRVLLDFSFSQLRALPHNVRRKSLLEEMS